MTTPITFRPYQALTDDQKVYQYLEDVYDPLKLNSYLIPPFFEYAKTHPICDDHRNHLMGLWEEKGVIVGLVAYEMTVDEAFVSVRSGYGYLLEEMVDYAKTHLYVIKDENRISRIWVIDHETDKRDLLRSKGYAMIAKDAVTIFDYQKPFPKTLLPPGYEIISLKDENDLQKIHRCLWEGFNHGDTPDDDLSGRKLMQSGPHFMPELTTIVKNPEGQYATYAGMWLDQKNHYAYLEPLATIPSERKKGLAQAALVAAMEKTKALGATYCFGGSLDFYLNMGFEPIAIRELWENKTPVLIAYSNS
ncbi:MAG: GNAT family N-acetyltransferase [Acholeplasmataceae bacterium]|nr:GNAT family N-acetyltransferase [Acholeplasmataceae bacterium]